MQLTNATWFHHDQLGSTRLLTDGAGTAVGMFTYDSYGSLIGRGGSVTSPLGYAGEYADAETGMQYLRARYHDPATGQFISRDPIEALTRSAYGYVGGNPLNATDPSGLWCLVHNDHGGCLGSGVIEAAQEPINVVGLAAAGLSFAASVLSEGWLADLNLPCAGAAKLVSTTAGAINTLASLETTVYACTVAGRRSTACIANFGGLMFSAANTLAQIAAPPPFPAGFAGLNLIASIALYNSKLTDITEKARNRALGTVGGYC